MRMAGRVGEVGVTVRWCAYSLLVQTSVSVVVRAHGKYIPHCFVGVGVQFAVAQALCV